MTQTLKLATVASVAAIGSALAGPMSAPMDIAAPAASAPAGDWCNSLKTFGKFHSDKDAAFIQELKFFGRMQWQYASIDGDDVNGDSFDNDFTEFRRVRVGAQIKFLNNFTLKGNANIVGDSAGSGESEHFGYQSFDELHLTYKIKGCSRSRLTRFPLWSSQDQPLVLNQLSHLKRLKRLNVQLFQIKFTPSATLVLRSWLLKVTASGTLGILSLDANDAIGGWSHGNALSLNSAWQVGGGELVFDAFYNLDADNSGDDELKLGYEWATSLSYEKEYGNWNVLVNAVYGSNGDDEYKQYADGTSATDRDGNFWGLVIMPSTYIIEDQLEFVARYQYQGSSEDAGIRTNSRYFRATDTGASVNSGRGDSHHSLYAGLNYYLCGHNSKVMTGIEYETLDTAAGDANATTLWAAYRMYF